MTEVSLKNMIASRISRFDSLQVIDAQKNHGVPLDVCDIIYSRKLLPVIELDESVESPFSGKAPIRGAGGLTMTYAVCPPGTGPSLHNHRQTYETFTVMRGEFQFTLGATGEESFTLGEFDTVSIPPGCYRAFTNTGDEEGVLQVIITGGVHDMADIYFPKSTAAAIAEKGEQYLDYFEAANLSFLKTE